MCNLYSLTKSQEAMRRLFKVTRDLTGNLPPLPDIFPDQMASIVRSHEGDRELVMMRWGMPGPPAFGGPRHEHSQYQKPALATLAGARIPLPGAGIGLL